MKIRLVKTSDGETPVWKIEQQWSRAFNVWENYFYPKDISYLSYDLAKKNYDCIVSGLKVGDKEILEETEI